MIKICDAYNINCSQPDRRVLMYVAVNFGGKLRSYCCLECANDDIKECSEGKDNLAKAVKDWDVFILDKGTKL